MRRINIKVFDSTVSAKVSILETCLFALIFFEQQAYLYLAIRNIAKI